MLVSFAAEGEKSLTPKNKQPQFIKRSSAQIISEQCHINDGEAAAPSRSEAQYKTRKGILPFLFFVK